MNVLPEPGPASETDAEVEITARFSREELVQGWRMREPRVPRAVPATRIGVKTDLGCVRENNEDKAEFYEPDDPTILAARGSVYAVADGMGGHAAGQIAAELAIKRFLSTYYDSTEPDIPTALAAAARAANDHVYGIASTLTARSGMGTTLTVLALAEDHSYVCHIGDSRAYVIRDGQIRQVTDDHSWVEEQVRLGAMTREEAELSPYRNVITRCIGPQREAEPEVYAFETLPLDTWVLCTDGLTGHVTDSEIHLIATDRAPSEACRQLIELACARGGRDNVTALVVRVDRLERTETA